MSLKIPENQLPTRDVLDTDYVRVVGTDGKSYRVPKSGFGEDITVDSSLSTSSENPVQNKVIDAALGDLREDLNEEVDYTSNLINNMVQVNLYKGSATWNGTWVNSSAGWAKNGTYKGFDVMSRTGTFSGLFKLINVEANKKYTFYAYVKSSIYANINLNITSVLSGYETSATVDNNSKVITVNADEWTRVFFTFTCTAAGTVAPRAEAVDSSTLDVAGYCLVEGEYADYNLADTVEDLNAIKNVTFNSADISMFTFEIGNISSTGDDVGSSTRIRSTNFIKISKGTLISVNSGAKYALFFYTSADAGTFQFRRTFRTNETIVPDDLYMRIAVGYTDNSAPADIDTLAEYVQISGYVANSADENGKHIFHVEKDGSGDFTSLVKAIEFAETYMDSIVYVGDGTWDIVDELGSTYIESVSSSQRGVVLKNRIHLIFSSNSVVTCNYTGTTENTIAWLAAFNSGEYGFTLENCTIQASNCRYCFHDERNSEADAYVNKYINCRFEMDNSESTASTHQCLGGGLGLDGYVEIDGCYFYSNIDVSKNVMWYHNSAAADGGAKSHIVVKNCYAAGLGRFGFHWYGNSQLITQVEVSGCSYGAPLHIAAETENAPYVNVNVTEWNNTVRT